MGMLGLLPVLLSFGAIDSLIPLLIIIILIGSAAAMTRGWDVFKLLGIDFVAGMAGAIVITGGVATVSALTYWKNRKRERERIANYTKNKTPLQTKP